MPNVINLTTPTTSWLLASLFLLCAASANSQPAPEIPGFRKVAISGCCHGEELGTIKQLGDIDGDGINDLAIASIYGN